MYLIVDVVMLSKIASPAKLITSITAELVHCHVLRNYCYYAVSKTVGHITNFNRMK